MRVSIEDVRNRAKAQVPEVYTEFASLVKGGSVVTAAIVIIDVIHNLPREFLAERLIYFGVSVVLALIPLVTYRRGVVMATASLGMTDYIFPLLMGVGEIALFLTLGIDIGSAGLMTKGVDFHPWWFASVVVTTTSATLLLAGRYFEAKPENYPSELSSLAQKYRKWVLDDLIGTNVFSAMALGGAIFSALCPQLHSWQLLGFEFHVDLFLVTAITLGAMGLVVCWVSLRQFNDAVKSL